MNKRRAFIFVFLAFVLSLVCAFAVACSGGNNDNGGDNGGGNGGGENQDVAVTEITLNEGSVTVQLYVGDTLQLIATVSPENATDKSVEWATSAPAIATVTQEGLVE
ncbi:MAG: Ig domain-containing protein, partial [Candidatus Coproplasma sp.]